jgi:hypothetical protein
MAEGPGHWPYFDARALQRLPWPWTPEQVAVIRVLSSGFRASESPGERSTHEQPAQSEQAMAALRLKIAGLERELANLARELAEREEAARVTRTLIAKQPAPSPEKTLRAAVDRILRHLYPHGVPATAELKTVTGDVNAWLEDEARALKRRPRIVSRDTVARALGRRKSPARRLRIVTSH